MGSFFVVRALDQPRHATYSDKILTEGDLEDIYAYLQSIPKPPDAKTIPLLNP